MLWPDEIIFLLEETMHKDLEDWLNKVWIDKDEIMAKSPTGHSGRGIHLGDKNPAIWAVYKIYSSSGDTSSAIPSFDEATVDAFIDDLDRLEKESNSEAVIQIGDDFVLLKRGELAMIKSKPFQKTTLKEQRVVTLDVKQIGNCFVHFVKKDSGATDRIYLNVHPVHLGRAFRRIYLLIQTEPFLASAKVTGPVGEVRADSIVIYLNDGQGIEPVVTKIRTYYVKNVNHFGAATPKLTAPVKGMPGVALGMQPPDITVLRSGGSYYTAPVEAQSFGFYRASLIFMALDRTRFKVSGQTDNDRADAFKRRAAKYFLAAGIDPDRPSEQSAPKNLKKLAELEYRIEGDLDDKGDFYRPGAKVHVKKK
jgi:HopA1 effector protein family